MLGSFDRRALTIALLAYLVTMLSLPATLLGDLLIMGCWVVVCGAMARVGMGVIVRRLLPVLPFIVLVGIFNPILDRVPLAIVEGVTITRGWVTFVAIILRGIFAVAAVTVVIEAVGFPSICNALRRLRVPKLFTEQLLFLHRYLFVIVDEAESMRQARLARSGGKRGLRLKVWGTLIGSLMIRTIDRAERIYGAMLARGYRGVMPERGGTHKWSSSDTLFLILATLPPLLVAIFRPIHQLATL